MAQSAVPIPENIHIINEGPKTIIRKRWFTAMVIPLLFFCLIWNTFISAWFITAITHKQWTMLLFGSMHAIVGIGIAYTVIAMFFNRTDITIAQGEVSIRTYPIPWTGNKKIPSSTIKQLYSKSQPVQNRNGSTISYELALIDKSDKQQTLLRGLTSAEEAICIETTIEEKLGIKDMPVRGEIPRV